MVRHFGQPCERIGYTAREPGEDSLEYRVCDRTFHCVEAWISIASPNRAPLASAGVVTATVRAGEVLTLPFPISDPDGNLATRIVDAAPSLGTATVVDDALSYSSSTVGQAAFHVRGCDAAPWSWCAGAWVVIDVTP